MKDDEQGQEERESDSQSPDDVVAATMRIQAVRGAGLTGREREPTDGLPPGWTKVVCLAPRATPGGSSRNEQDE